MKKVCNLILAILFVSSMGFVFIQCAPVEEVEDIFTTDEYMDFSDVEEEHEVGTTQCPQKLKQILVLNDGVEGLLEPLDSAVFSCDHSAIDVYVNDDKESASCSFENTTSNTLNIEFNCGQTTDVTTDVKCDFYEGGSLIQSKNLNVKLSVK